MKLEEKKPVQVWAYSIFNQEDIADFKEVFEFYDDQKKGVVTSTQVRTTLRALIPKPKEDDIDALYDDIEKNKDGVVDFNGYLDVLHNAIEAIRKQQKLDKKSLKKNQVKTFDTDLTEEQLNEIRESFNMFDQNGDGTISIEELKEVMTNLGQSVSDENIQEMLEDVDTDAEGNLDFESFRKIMTQKMATTDINKEMQEAFNFFDQDGDGTITAEELRLCMQKLGEELTEDEIKEMLKEADADGNGEIEYAEFVKLITGPNKLL